MDDLFGEYHPTGSEPPAPLADRMRPKTLDDVLGQEHLTGPERPLRRFLESGDTPSIIFWGPPGTGKTSLALVIATLSGCEFMQVSAVEAGVKDVRIVISKASALRQRGKRTILFIDEIHRFNKSQQDALLGAVEKGTITLIGATTENPSFEVNSALLSRCLVYTLKPLQNEHIRQLILHAIKHDAILKQTPVEIADWDFLFQMAAGDARRALNAIEAAFHAVPKSAGKVEINRNLLEKVLQQKAPRYDKKGESHYDTISAFIKSLRGSDPDAAILWLAKMLDAGEDPKFIARRMVIFASEDIGNADTYAITLAVSVFNAVNIIGMPEARINLAQGVTYLASCKKSNASYLAIDKALSVVQNMADPSVPLHLRNAPTTFMKKEGYGAGYKYPHNYPEHFVREHYFPEGMSPEAFYQPTEQGSEKRLKEYLETLWGDRYKSKS